MIECTDCGDDVPVARVRLGYDLCLKCGEAAAKAARRSWCIAPMHKSNYMLITNRTDLAGINSKGGIVTACNKIKQGEAV